MDKNKIIEAAAKLVAKGAYEKAIKEYQRVLETDPKDVRILQKMGELYQKKNDSVQAAQYFIRVAESYSGDGFFLKAVALYKQVLKLNPTLIDVNIKLAELHQQLGLMSEAMAYFQTVANYYDKAGDTRSSLDTLKRMVELDPENVASRIKLAELYSRENMNGEAIAEFKRAADYLQRNNRGDDYLRVAERISTLEPGNLELAKQLATAYLGRGDQKRALAKLQVCFKADSKNVDTLGLLAQAFLGLGQTSKTVSVYKELAQILGEQGQSEEARKVWTKIAELDPADPDLPAKAQSAPVAAPRPKRAEIQQPTQPGPSPAREAQASASLSKDGLTKLLTETDVYLKYGLHDKALDHLQKIFAVDPENLDAHEKAYGIYVASNNDAQAEEQLLNVLRLCSRLGHQERAQPYLTALLELNPTHSEVPAFLAALRPGGGEPSVEEAISDDAILVDASDEEVFVAEAPVDALVDAAEDMALLNASAPEADEILSQAEVTRFEFDSADSVPAASVEETVVVATDEDEPLGTSEAEPTGPHHDEELSADLAVDIEIDNNTATVVAPLASIDSGENLEPAADECNEAAFFLDQGLADEAREVLETILIAYPGHRYAIELLQRIDNGLTGAATTTRPSGSSEPQDAFDLAAELANEIVELNGAEGSRASGTDDDFQYSVEEVFSEFKKGIQKVVKAEDVDTHYDLGIAYREMGLTDDAIGEFNTALKGCRGKRKEIDCLTMLGHMQSSKGDYQAAVASFKQALSSEFITTDSAKALEYELGLAWEQIGSPGKALFYYQRVTKMDAKYRDVSKLVGRLGASTQPEPDLSPHRNGRRDAVQSAVESPGKKSPEGESVGTAPGGKTRKVGYV